MPPFPALLLALAACAPAPLQGHWQGVCTVVPTRFLGEPDPPYTIPLAVDLTATSELESAGEGTFLLPGGSGAGPATLGARELTVEDELSAGLVLEDDASDGQFWAFLRTRDDVWGGECGWFPDGVLETNTCDGAFSVFCDGEDVTWSGSGDGVEAFADDVRLEGNLGLTRSTEELPDAEGDPFEPDS